MKPTPMTSIRVGATVSQRPSGRALVQARSPSVSALRASIARWFRPVSLALGYRKQRIIREARAEAARKGHATQRANQRARDPLLNPIPFNLPADDWAPCRSCDFISVACDCDGFTKGETL